MRDKVLNYIKINKILDHSDRVIVGVSGGPDSTALLYFLNSIKDQYKLDLFVCHLNHMIRGNEADEDEVFVRELCEDMSIEFYSKKANIPKIAKDRRMSVEEAGREERYSLFYDVAKELKATKIALAHHKDDNVETILMRFIRGTGIKGLGGISFKRRDGVIRPFLCVGKGEILKYCELNRIPSRLDKTNLDNQYHRNRIRLDLIPYLEEMNPNISENINNLGAICREYYDYVYVNVKEALKELAANDKIDIGKFNTLHPLLRREILIYLINQLDSNCSIEYHHIALIIEKLEESHSTVWSIDLPKEIRAVRQYDYLFFSKGPELAGKRYCYRLLVDKVYVFPILNMSLVIKTVPIEEFKEKGKDVAYFDFDKIILSGKQLYLRSRKNGDRIQAIGLKGTKKVKDVFIDKKIPLHLRWKIPLLCVDDEILWIIGYHKSSAFTISENTKRALKIYCVYHEEDITNEK